MKLIKKSKVVFANDKIEKEFNGLSENDSLKKSNFCITHTPPNFLEGANEVFVTKEE